LAGSCPGSQNGGTKSRRSLLGILKN